MKNIQLKEQETLRRLQEEEEREARRKESERRDRETERKERERQEEYRREKEREDTEKAAQEQEFESPVWQELGALTKSGKALGVRSFYSGDPVVMPEHVAGVIT